MRTGVHQSIITLPGRSTHHNLVAPVLAVRQVKKSTSLLHAANIKGQAPAEPTKVRHKAFSKISHASVCPDTAIKRKNKAQPQLLNLVQSHTLSLVCVQLNLIHIKGALM